MKIHSPSGRLSFKEFTFPDGQPHFELLTSSEFREATIEAPIRSANELFRILLAKDALTASGHVVSLDVRYLLGARMDRAISARQPFTLAVIARMIQQAGFKRVRVLDPHSEVSESLLSAVAVMPVEQVMQVLAALPSSVRVIAPDAGAKPRIERLLTTVGLRDSYIVADCVKHRNSATGQLSGFQVVDPSIVRGHECLILDDICDGGGTFVGLAQKLTEAGATAVDLFVTHGIFSKGIKLEGIRCVYTTDSYFNWANDTDFICLPIEMTKA